MTRRGTTTALVIAALCATTVVIVALLIFQWRSFRGVEETDSLVRSTLEAERDFTALANRIVDAETGQRGFLLTGIQAYLKPYNEAVDDVPREIARLKRLTAKNPTQLRRVELVDTLSAAKLAELSSTVKLANEGHRDSALEVVRTNVGDSLMTSIRLVLRDAIRAEDSIRNARENALSSAFQRRDTIAAGLAALLIVMLSALAFVLRRIQRYRDLVMLCAWSKAVNYQGEWMTFEEYLRRRFGLSTTHGISPKALATMEKDIEAGGSEAG